MSFQFGTPASGAGSGQSGSTTAPAGALFGAKTGATTTGATSTPPSLFSKPGGTSTPQTGGMGNLFAPKGGMLSSFGNTGTTATPSTTAPLTGPFGQAAGASSGGSLFGAANKPAGGNLFSTTSAPASGTATPTTAPSLFGNKTTATGTAPSMGAQGGTGGFFAPQSAAGTASTGPGMFGNTGGMFSSAPPATGTLGGQATPAKTTFGGLGSTTPAGAPPADSSKPAGTGVSLFGAGLGSKPAAPAATMGNMFAQTPAPTAQPGNAATAGTTSLFGPKPSTTPAASGTPSLFSGAAPAAPASGAASTAPATGAKQLFGMTAGTTPSSTPAPTTSATTAPRSLFSAAPTTTTPAASSAAAVPSLFNTAAPTTTAPSSSATAGTISFGMTPAATAAPSSSTPAAATSLFPKPASTTAPAAGTPAPTTTAAPAAGLLGGAKPAGTTAGTPAQDGRSTAAGFSASTMGPASQLPRLKNKTMDEIITRWATDLSKYQKEFKEQASKVAEWDRMLVDNGEKIQKLYTGTYEAERASNEIERQLSNVESQQEELTAWLDRYEQDLNELFSKSIGTSEQVTGPDQERERTYKLAEKLTDRLDDMGKDLTKMIKEINDMSSTLSKGSKPDDPLTQIVRVLNGHLSQLQWIDTNAAALQAKVTAAQKASSNMGTHASGAETDAAESFYRSYRGGYK